jgi:hypothetical protein
MPVGSECSVEGIVTGILDHQLLSNRMEHVAQPVSVAAPIDAAEVVSKILNLEGISKVE